MADSHAAGASRRRLILAAKVGVAVALSSLLSLVDAAYRFSDSGAWAVVTAVIVMQPTLGSTAYKVQAPLLSPPLLSPYLPFTSLHRRRSAFLGRSSPREPPRSAATSLARTCLSSLGSAS